MLSPTSLEARNEALRAIQRSLREHAAELISANAADVAAAISAKLGDALIKRLGLTDDKLSGLCRAIDGLIDMPDPLGVVTLDRELSPGLQLKRHSCPIGVLCVIFEAVSRSLGSPQCYSSPKPFPCSLVQRPEAVIQISTLALKSGNTVILKGGKEAARTNEALVRAIQAALAATASTAGCISPSAVQLVAGRDEVADLLQLDEHIDLVIPRGSKELVRDIKRRTVRGHLCLNDYVSPASVSLPRRSAAHPRPWACRRHLRCVCR